MLHSSIKIEHRRGQSIGGVRVTSRIEVVSFPAICFRDFTLTPAVLFLSWSSDGVIAYLQGGNGLQSGDIWVLPPDGEPTPFFTSEADKWHATFSPDGKWLAYSAVAGSRGVKYTFVPTPVRALQS